jgi:radical SAM/SPASM domain protein of ACGX system
MEYFAFQWHITDSCDQRCQHCYIFSESDNIHLKEMGFPEIESVFENCLDMCRKANRLPYFYITGGDPILHSRFWDLMQLLKSHDIPFTILGNPFHLNDKVCQKLKSFGCERYQLSIDGLRDTHDKIRKRGSFDTTLEKIKCIRDAGIRCAIMTTVSGTNKHDIPGIIDMVVEHQADVFAFARYCPTSTEKAAHLTASEYREVLEACWQKFEFYKDRETSFNLKDHLWTLFLYEKGLFKISADLQEDRIYEGCNCGNCHLTVLPDGGVYACRRFDSKMANALQDNLYDIFTGDKMDQFRQYDKFEKCSSCELIRFCRGCPAVTYGYTGNFYGADPQCWKQIIN